MHLVYSSAPVDWADQLSIHWRVYVRTVTCLNELVTSLEGMFISGVYWDQLNASLLVMSIQLINYGSMEGISLRTSASLV